jgi:hypothetical protein
MTHPNLAHFEDCTDIVETLELTDEQRATLVEAPQGAFTPIGIGHVAVLELDLALGIRKRGGDNLPETVARGLVTAGKLLAEVPALEPRLPLFSAVVRGEDGQEIGLLTQDFSNGGETALQKEFFPVPDMGPIPKPTPLHGLVHDVLGATKLDRRVYSRMTAVTADWQSSRVLVDFHRVLRPGQEAQPIAIALERIDEVTIQL